MSDVDPIWPSPPFASPLTVALAYLAELAEWQRSLATEFDQAVADAVAVGADWGQVGRATGRTRQGARQRWSHRLPPPRLVAHDDLIPTDEPGDAPADHVPRDIPVPLEIPDPALSAWLWNRQVRCDQPPEDPWADSELEDWELEDWELEDWEWGANSWP